MKLILTAILFILTCAFANAQETNWKEFTSIEGGFSVLLPDHPTANKLTVNTVSGMKQAYTFSYSDEDLNDYMIAYSQYEETKSEKTSDDKLFDRIRDGIILAQQGRLINETTIVLDAFKGREIKIESPDKKILIERFYLVENRFYQLSVETKQSEAKSESINRFLNSFKLLVTKR